MSGLAKLPKDGFPGGLGNGPPASWWRPPKQPPPCSLTHAAWLLSRPLVILLARDCLLPHQFKGGLALKGECVPVMKPGAFPPAVGRDARITATALLNLWKTGRQKTETKVTHTPLRAGRPQHALGSEGHGGREFVRNPAAFCVNTAGSPAVGWGDISQLSSAEVWVIHVLGAWMISFRGVGLHSLWGTRVSFKLSPKP